MSDEAGEQASKKERSPSFPFISLRKAEERARVFWDRHRREAARLVTIAPTWGYQPKSSGLQQTVGALKQYGLVEDMGSGTERKVQLSDLGRRLVADQRPGAREAALKEAALRPRLFQEYSKWVYDAPSEAHRLSELELDRGFTVEAAKVFLRSFDETVQHAGLSSEDSLSSPLHDAEEEELKDRAPSAPVAPAQAGLNAGLDPARLMATVTSPETPFSERCQVFIAPGVIKVAASFHTSKEIERLIRLLECNKALLDKETNVFS